jgi:hypothetical protein
LKRGVDLIEGEKCIAVSANPHGYLLAAWDAEVLKVGQAAVTSAAGAASMAVLSTHTLGGTPWETHSPGSSLNKTTQRSPAKSTYAFHRQRTTLDTSTEWSPP